MFILKCVHELVALGYSPVFILNCVHELVALGYSPVFMRVQARLFPAIKNSKDNANDSSELLIFIKSVYNAHT